MTKVCAGLALALLCAWPFVAHTQSSPANSGKPIANTISEQGPLWRELTKEQRSSLQPLEPIWSSISIDRKLKWLEIAQRMPPMSEDERSRIQARMGEWAKLSPSERGQVRLNFREAKQLSAEQRQAQWKAYQALSDEQKRQLADGRISSAAGNSGERQTAPARHRPTPPVSSQNLTNASKKSNITPNPAFAQPPTPVAPTLLHAGTGATTTLVTRLATPPLHQQVGLPKIVATPQFIDTLTLLPNRGPQAAMTFAVVNADPLERP